MKSLIKECMIIARKADIYIVKCVSQYENKTTTKYCTSNSTTIEKIENYNLILKAFVYNEFINSNSNEKFEIIVPDYCPCCGSFKGFVVVQTTARKCLLGL